MKKIVIGVCGFLVFIGGLAGIRSGVLKAEELTKDSSLIVETGTVESAVSIPESQEPSINEGIVPESEVAAPVQEQVEEPVPETSEPSVPPVSSESEAPSSSEPVSSESSTTDSSTSTSSSSSSSTTASSTSPTNSSPASSTTKPSGTTPSSTKPSSTKPSTTTPSSSMPTQPSTSQSQKEPNTSKQSVGSTPVPVAPSTPAAVNPVTPNTTSVQSSSFVAPTAPDAFSETSNLNLPAELKTSEVAQSDLKGFELPLLSSFEDKNHAALIYEGIKQLGTAQEENYSTEQFTTDIYQNLFNVEITGKLEKLPEEITVGSLIYQKIKIPC